MTNSATAQFVWLTDLHFDVAPVLDHDPIQRLDAAVAYINATYPDAAFCVISGDIVETASDDAYAEVKSHLGRLVMPFWPMTGNHDRRALMRRHLDLPDSAMDRFVQYALEAGPVRVLCLDSLCEGEAKGELCQTRFDWLEHQLTQDQDRPTLIMLHHPPMALGLPMLDPDRLEQGDTLLELLARFPNVRQLCFGHVHRPVTGRLGHLSYCGLRSILYQAPPPYPLWDWDSFAPALEAPELAVVSCSADQIGFQMLQFCPADLGVTRGEKS